ncbi:MAG: DNA polymerase III subunit delta [Sulfurovum sp.]
MYQREFDQKQKQKLLKSVLFYGDNEYLIESYIDSYISRLNARENMLNLYHDEWDFTKAKSFLSQSSLFGGVNLLIVKSNKKIPKKELDVLIAQSHKSSDNYFLYYYGGEGKNAKSMQNAFLPKFESGWVRFFEPNINEGVTLLQQKAQKIKLDIDFYALQHLMLILNNNLSLASNELTKLAILDMRITSKDVDRLVYSTSSLATEQLLIELFAKKPIIASISKLLELGEDELSLLRTTQYFVNEIFLFQAYIKLNNSVDSASILGYKLPKQIEEQKAKLAMSVKSSSLLKIFEHLLESELIIKKAPTTQKEVLIYSMLIKIQSFL